MKVEQLLAQYLYNNKKVTLQDIGSFTLSPNAVISTEDKEMLLPEGSIVFEYDAKAKQDEGLIDYIVQQTRKIKPLASSDLESYSILGRQFLNIGKPFHIEGMGTLHKTQEGTYEFTQGHTVNARLEAPVAALKEKYAEDVDFSTPEKEHSGKKGWVIGLLLLFVVIAGAAVFYYLRNQQTEVPVEQTETVTADTTSNLNSQLPVDSTTLVNPTPQTSSDGYSFKVVIKEYPTKEAAEKAYKKLSSYGHTLVLSPIDSTRYKLAIPFTSPLADTLRAKDSLSKFFQSKAYIVL